jgi:hypothetical protein
MNTLRIETREGRTAFRPGDEIVGTASWELAKPPKAVELRLFWFTRGKGTTDVKVAQAVAFEYPRENERRDFRVRLPDAPFSFSGKLVSLIWALELVALPGNDSTRLELVMSPTASEITG